MYISAHHPDIMKVLDTKRENADEKIRIKTLSVGVIITDALMNAARKGEQYHLFSPYDIEKEYRVPMTSISITDKYDELVANGNIKKTLLDARTFLQTVSELQFESGYPYIMFEDQANRRNNIHGRINMSNLCVAPETLLLTRSGYEPIENLAGQDIEVWNGEKFSLSRVEKTGTDQELITVNFSNGASLDVTSYHKFYIKTGEDNGEVKEVRAGELKPGDKLDKFDLPVITEGKSEGDVDPYDAGVFSVAADHSDEGCPIEYSIDVRLKWLAGVMDIIGKVDESGDVYITSVDSERLESIRILLTTLGIHSGWSELGAEECLNPDNSRVCSEDERLYRLVIKQSEAQKLRELGLPTHRVIIEEVDLQRSAINYITVDSVEAHGRISDTYCLNEPEKHKVVFEGIQTGNCSEILQVNSETVYDKDNEGVFIEQGRDISCNLGSLNIARVMEKPSQGNPHGFEKTVSSAVRALTFVSDSTDLGIVASVHNGNHKSHAIGLGAMNLHGFLGSVEIDYGSEESLDFVNCFFATMRYFALKESVRIARERNESFFEFEKSQYAQKNDDGLSVALEKYTSGIWRTTPQTKRIKDLFNEREFWTPTVDDWISLDKDIMEHGLYNAYLMAVAPTGSISYVNNSTASVHPIVSQIETRKEGKIGRVYVASPHMTNENRVYFRDAYSIGYKPIIDVYAAAQKHVDQGMSLTLFYNSDATTRDMNRAYIYAWSRDKVKNDNGDLAINDPELAWKSGFIKTLYYARIKQKALEGTQVEDCASCLI